MSSRIIIDGNAIYEVDEECLRKKKKKENLFLHGKSFLDRTYPVIVEIRTERHVPIIVALPVIR